MVHTSRTYDYLMNPRLSRIQSRRSQGRDKTFCLSGSQQRGSAEDGDHVGHGGREPVQPVLALPRAVRARQTVPLQHPPRVRDHRGPSLWSF